MKSRNYMLAVAVSILAPACSMDEPAQTATLSEALVSGIPHISSPDWHQIAPGVLEKKGDNGSVIRYAVEEEGVSWLIGQAAIELVEWQKRYESTHSDQASKRVDELQALIAQWGEGSLFPKANVCEGGGGTCTCSGGCYGGSGGCGCL